MPSQDYAQYDSLRPIIADILEAVRLPTPPRSSLATKIRLRQLNDGRQRGAAILRDADERDLLQERDNILEDLAIFESQNDDLRLALYDRTIELADMKRERDKLAAELAECRATA